MVEQIIEDTSRMIDDITGRMFYESSTAASARYFTAPTSRRCYIDDALSITQVAVDDSTLTYPYILAATDYTAQPKGKTPTTYLETTPQGMYYFDTEPAGVKVTAIWGYCAIADLPGPVRRACLIHAGRVYVRQKAMFGITSTGELAPLASIAIDEDIVRLLDPYIKRWGG